jgi:hypothetical protein
MHEGMESAAHSSAVFLQFHFRYKQTSCLVQLILNFVLTYNELFSR